MKISPTVSKVAKGTAVLAASTALVFFTAAPVSAHSGHYIFISDAGKAKFEGSWLTVCDIKVDGRQVRAHLKSNTGTIYYSGWAPSQSCTTEGHPTSIIQFRVCAEVVGCSAWHDRY